MPFLGESTWIYSLLEVTHESHRNGVHLQLSSFRSFVYSGNLLTYFQINFLSSDHHVLGLYGQNNFITLVSVLMFLGSNVLLLHAADNPSPIKQENF